MYKLITTDGSILTKKPNPKRNFFLRKDKNNNFAWKSLLKVNAPNSSQKFEKFKNRFLK